MRRVQQEHSQGCGIACVAMVTDRTYQDIAKLVPRFDGSRGIDYTILLELLNRHGLHYQMVFATDTLTNTPRTNWPPALPFAYEHIACVEIPAGTHYVVWLRNGVVLDPNREGQHQLSDYGKCHHIIAINVFRAPTPRAADD